MIKFAIIKKSNKSKNGLETKKLSDVIEELHKEKYEVYNYFNKSFGE